MFDIILTLLALIGTGTASYIDIKRGKIPNRLSFSLIALGLFANLMFALHQNNLSLFFLTLQNVLMISFIGGILWYVNAWSGGDAKVFMFIASLLPQYPISVKGYFNPFLAPYPFILTILINTILISLPCILIYERMKKEKERIPFIPIVFMGLILSLVFGDLFIAGVKFLQGR